MLDIVFHFCYWEPFGLEVLVVRLATHPAVDPPRSDVDFWWNLGER